MKRKERLEGGAWAKRSWLPYMLAAFDALNGPQALHGQGAPLLQECLAL